jgi:hypothetical protein
MPNTQAPPPTRTGWRGVDRARETAEKRRWGEGGRRDRLVSWRRVARLPSARTPRKHMRALVRAQSQVGDA